MALIMQVLLLGASSAASDGWTPIIPEDTGSSPGGRHALAVEPGLPGSLASSIASSLAASLGPGSSYHSQVDHLVGPPSHSHPYRPLSHPHPSPSALPDFQLHSSDHGDTCALYKAGMTQDLYFQASEQSKPHCKNKLYRKTKK